MQVRKTAKERLAEEGAQSGKLHWLGIRKEKESRGTPTQTMLQSGSSPVDGFSVQPPQLHFQQLLHLPLKLSGRVPWILTRNGKNRDQTLDQPRTSIFSMTMFIIRRGSRSSCCGGVFACNSAWWRFRFWTIPIHGNTWAHGFRYNLWTRNILKVISATPLKTGPWKKLFGWQPRIEKRKKTPKTTEFVGVCPGSGRRLFVPCPFVGNTIYRFCKENRGAWLLGRSFRSRSLNY